MRAVIFLLLSLVSFTAQSAVGRTEGQPSVSFYGDSLYAIPLWVPPGTNGLSPDLSLNYSSGGSNGWMGMGFTIPTLSIISRCNRTQAQDGGSGTFAPLFNQFDKFCIDGSRLRLTSAGTYGAAGTVYQTERESFRQITISAADANGPISFIVKANNGFTYEYGNTTDSRIRLINGSGGLSNVRLHWALNRIKDRDGNFVDLTYTQDAARGGYYPLEIQWTGNTNGTQPKFKIAFVNETADRFDSIFNRMPVTAGASDVFDYFKRLGRIDVYYIPTNRLLRRYQLTYEAAGPVGSHSRLQQVQECGLDAADCFSPTTLTWYSQTATTSVGSTGETVASGVRPLNIDINGDSRDDLVWATAISGGTWRYMLANSTGGFNASQPYTLISSTNWATAQVIEWNGDGKQDLIVHNTDGFWWVLRSNSSGFDAPISTGVAATFPTAFADINGDGLHDLVRKQSGLSVRLRTGAAFGAETVGLTTAWPVSNIYPINSKRRQDFDGDGLEDLVVQLDQIDALGNHTFRMTTVFGAGPALRAGLDYGAVTYLGSTGDWNDDGRTDIAWISGGTIRSNMNPFAGPATGTAQTVADWDGDGKDDLLIYNGSTWSMARSDGTAFQAPVSISISGSPARVGDFDGDGFNDMAIIAGTLQTARHLSVDPWVYREYLKSATDGFGVAATFGYGLLSDPLVHTVIAGPGYPLKDDNDPRAAVKTLVRTDETASGSTYSVNYTYTGARINYLGRGFVGFEKRTRIDSRTGGLRLEESFKQDFPYIGMPTAVALKQNPSGTPVQLTTNAWSSIAYGAGFETRNFPYLSNVKIERYELGGPQNGIKFATLERSVAAIDSISGMVTDATTLTTENATGLFPTSTKSERVYIPSVLNNTTEWCIGREQSLELSNSHSLAWGAQVTRHFATVWDAPKCRETQSTIEPSDPQWQVTTDYSYDSFGNLSTVLVTPAAGQGQSSRTTTLNWGSDGRFPRTLTNPKGHITRLQWDTDTGNCTAGTVTLGIVRCVTDPNNLNTVFEVDVFGRVTRELRPDGTATDRVRGECTSANAFCNGSSALRWSVQSILRNTSNGAIRTDADYFDMFDRLRETRRPTLGGANSRVTSDYDSLGRLAARSEPFFDGNPVWATSYSYDALGRSLQVQRQTSESDTSISTTLMSYEGLRTTTTDPLTHTATSVRNAVGQVVQMIDAIGSDTDYEYDAFGNLLKTRDVSGNEVSATYNVRGMKMTSVDPDMGSWSYNYYPLGELKRQDDAKTPSQHVDFTYDELSRALTRIEAEGTTTFVFDSAVNGVGRLKSATSPGGYSETNSYDTLSRLSQVSVVADGSTYQLDQSYNSTTGLLETLTYPTSTAGVRFKLRYNYANALPQSVQQYTGDVLGTVYWQANASNARGQIIDQQLGNGLKTIAGYDRITGLVDDIISGPGGGSARQNHEYTWNKVGSLVSRREVNLNHIETFFYDALDRLDHSQLDGVTNLTMTYNAIGNILSKSDVGTYTYHATKKHAVTAAGSFAYTYDANGNALTRHGGSITWASYNLPTVIGFSDGSFSQFQYGADRSRFKQVAFTASSGSTETTIYIKDMFERLTRATTTEYKHYIFAPGGAVALHNRKSTGVNETVYLLNDHLGSVVMLTNSSGFQIQRLSNAAFGKRRNGGTWAGVPGASEKTAISNTTRRGFTQHEQLDNLYLVHMNGRVFDVLTGRFLSADPYVPAPYFSQSWNRYSYTFNNPLSFTDPSGFAPDPDDPPGPADRPNPFPGRGGSPWGSPFIYSIDSLFGMFWMFVTPGMEVENAERNDARFQVARSPTAGADCANCPVPPLLAGGAARSTVGGTDDRVLPSFGRGLLHRYRSVVDGPPTFSEELGRGTRQAFDNLVTVASALLMVVPGGQPSGAALLETRAAAGIAGSIRNVNPLRSLTNCVNCAIATDATLAGRAASALPSGATQIALLESYFGGQFSRVSGQSAIEALMLGAGPGARGIVFGSRGAGEVGHVFNAVNQGGTIRFLDGQIGGAASFEGFTEFFFLRTF